MRVSTSILLTALTTASAATSATAARRLRSDYRASPGIQNAAAHRRALRQYRQLQSKSSKAGLDLLDSMSMDVEMSVEALPVTTTGATEAAIGSTEAAVETTAGMASTAAAIAPTKAAKSSKGAPPLELSMSMDLSLPEITTEAAVESI